MNKNALWKIILLVVAAAGLYFAVTVLPGQQASQNESTNEQAASNVSQASTFSITIEDLYKDKQVELLPGQTLFQAMQSLNREDQQVRLVSKEYQGLGMLIESLAGKTNGTDQSYWQFTVNGVMPQVGSDQYKLVPGDRVEWVFDKSEF